MRDLDTALAHVLAARADGEALRALDAWSRDIAESLFGVLYREHHVLAARRDPQAAKIALEALALVEPLAAAGSLDTESAEEVRSLRLPLAGSAPRRDAVAEPTK